MEDVSDFAFRKICKAFGVDLLFTEFIASDGIIRKIEKSINKAAFDESERPIGIQIFGNNIDTMQEAAIIAETLQPDLIDINFGCPVRKIASKGCGAGILNDLPKMVDITSAVVKAVKLPVTVKTRLGWDDNHKNIEEITLRLQETGIKAITIHGRTRAQMYKGMADWSLIGAIKNNPNIKIPVIGNGDIDCPEKALDYKKKYKVDGIMIGRAAVGNPWIFRQINTLYNTALPEELPTVKERIEICKKHLIASIELYGERAGILIMRKHYSGYFRGIPDFKKFRLKLVTTDNYKELFSVLDEIESCYGSN